MRTQSANGNQGSKWIRKERRLAIYLRDRFECGYCGRDLRDATSREVTLDHLIPRSEGGTNQTHNLTTACLRCNSQRGAQTWTEYAPAGSIDRIRERTRQPLNMDLAKAIIAGQTNRVEALR